MRMPAPVPIAPRAKMRRCGVLMFLDGYVEPTAS
jgi:hypothetical protein